MARKSKTLQLTEGIAGQHLALSVAAHLARTQLIPDPLKVYDGQHLTDMLNVVGLALARTAPLHVVDPAAGARAFQRSRGPAHAAASSGASGAGQSRRGLDRAPRATRAGGQSRDAAD